MKTPNGAKVPNGVKVIERKVFSDARGFFVERFNLAQFEALGIPTEFVQDNHSRSLPGVVRGLHYQTNPAQGKLVMVIRGSILDVIVDLRKSSATFGQVFTIELSAENGKAIWIPSGFAHGFSVLGHESADVLYKVDDYYSPQSEGGILWNDSELAIDWKVKDPILSEKDQALPAWSEFKKNPIFP